jgi:hypothetical protein
MSTDYRALCAELNHWVVELAASHPNLSDSAITWINEVADRAASALAQPEPVAPTDEELLASVRHFYGDQAAADMGAEDDLRTARAVYDLARYGTPSIEPVPVSERLPGPEELATLVPLMHRGASLCHSEGFYEESDAIGRIADLLEQLMPQAGGATND